jgi:hypothetical protein
MPSISVQPVSFMIVIEKPPAGIMYGIQKGSGNNFETFQKQISAGGDIGFEVEALVKTGKEGHPDFSGPFIQGPPGGRFIYLGIGSYAGQTDGAFNGRLKVPLPKLSSVILSQLEGPGQLRARIPGTNPKNGRPSMATVQPTDGWVVVPAK